MIRTLKDDLIENLHTKTGSTLLGLDKNPNPESLQTLIQWAYALEGKILSGKVTSHRYICEYFDSLKELL